ncbi:MAG: LysM peptidoglycan-binding domain-containing protein [Patescibacteria group bacterium]
MVKQEMPQEEQMSESYISVGLGILVVVVVGILLYNYFTQRGTKNTDTSNQDTEQLLEATTSAKPGTTYTVVSGDTLWSISEKAYGTGFNWQQIKELNKLSTDALVAGQQLTIPEIIASPTTEIAEASVAPSATTSTLTSPIPLPSTSVEASPMTQLSPEASPVVTITGTSYTVKEGDTLWSIACQAYGDCYAWVKIAKSNNLINPDLIHPGNVFNLPR